METKNTKSVSLSDIAKTFLVIGATGFGGGMAVVALIQEVCVARKKWVSLDEFTHGVAFGQILGPFMVNATTFVGYRLRGLTGAVVAVLSLLAPSIVLVIVLSALYFRYHHVPSLQSALRGISPVVIALIVNAAYQMGWPRLQKPEAAGIAVGAFALSLFLHMQVYWILLLIVAYGALRLRIGPKEGTGAA